MALTLFKNICDELTDLEKKVLVPMLIDTLCFKEKHRTITGRNISAWFKASGYNVTEVRVRKMVNYIRVMRVKKGVECHLENKVVIGAGNGYFVTDDPEVVKNQIESIRGRIDSMLAVEDSLIAELTNLQHKKTA